MAAIVRDLRVMSHGNIDTLQALELLPVLESASTIALSNARARIELTREFGAAPMVVGNPVKLGQVFLNLLVNAAQALEGLPDRAPRIVLRTAIAGDGQVHVTIADNGSGISADHLGHICEPFFTTKPVGVGTGLGLPICHTIVSSLGGEIRVESTQGVGTTFTVILPNGCDGVDEITRRLDLAAMRRVA
jgi:C4-dicarboxylate-specific signal transduction histidine kinase